MPSTWAARVEVRSSSTDPAGPTRPAQAPAGAAASRTARGARTEAHSRVRVPVRVRTAAWTAAGRLPVPEGLHGLELGLQVAGAAERPLELARRGLGQGPGRHQDHLGGGEADGVQDPL